MTAAPGVAIVGMACLFPGAPDVDAYWRNILGKVDAVSDPPPESWDPDVYYDPEFSDPDRTYCRRGGYLGSLAAFDPLPYGIPPVAVGGEPDQWLALAVAHAALADAGALDLPDEIRTKTAIILGKGTYLNGGNAIAVQRGLVVGQTIDLIRGLHPEYGDDELAELRSALQAVLPPLTPDTVPGLIPNIIVGRIANRLDLMGPAYTVDAACASSLVAVGHAVRDLRSGECDLALAGGSQVWMPVATLNLFCRLGALSRREQLRAFDKDADGTLLGEGIGMVVLKRLPDAVRDGDRVYAVIRGVGVSSDGRGLGVMAPRREGEELALRRAYDSAGVPPETVGLIEAHGTGTPVGDVTEVRSLTAVFGERDGELPRCALGTVKSMISHTIPAAGVAGLIKTALALHHRVLPPTLHCDEPNPELELERTPFYINTETRPWIHGGPVPRRAGINAFGFGGINAHAVLEEFEGEVRRDHRPPWETEVCVLEAESAAELADRADALAAALAGEDRFSLIDLAHTLAGELGETPGRRRLAIVASSVADLRAKLGQAIEKLRAPDCARIRTMSGIYYESRPLGRDAKCAFVFPGEGSQYPGMLSDLCLHFGEARAVFDRIDRLYVDHPRGHLLSDWVFPRPAFSDSERARTEARLMELDIAVESVLTANAAVYAVVSRLVRRIDALVGHSTGEHSAAMAAGALDLDTDERLGHLLSRPARLLRRRRRPPRRARGGPAGPRHRCRERGSHRRRRRPGAVPGDGQLSPSGGAGGGGGRRRARPRACRGRGDRVRAASLRPRGAHAAVRSLRGGPAGGLRPAARPRPGPGTVVLHDGGPLPRRPGGDTRAARRALDVAGAIPGDDGGSPRRRRPDLHRGGSAREPHRVRPGHPPRPGVLRRRRRHAAPVRHHPAQPSGRDAVRSRRRPRPRVPVRGARGRPGRLERARLGGHGSAPGHDPAGDELADAPARGRGARALAAPPGRASRRACGAGGAAGPAGGRQRRRDVGTAGRSGNGAGARRRGRRPGRGRRGGRREPPAHDGALPGRQHRRDGDLPGGGPAGRPAAASRRRDRRAAVARGAGRAPGPAPRRGPLPEGPQLRLDGLAQRPGSGRGHGDAPGDEH